jgi:FkbM family methyltransferase
MLRGLWKPWYVYRPAQIVRRAVASIAPPHRGYRRLTTSWGADILVDPARTVGRSIATTAVYDLAVSEALFRLADEGDTVIDAGANVGYMSVLLSFAIGSNGTLLSFEPHPELFEVLQANVRSARPAAGATELYNVALGDAAGTGRLVVPSQFAENDGISYIGRGDDPTGSGIEVPVTTIDDALAARCATLMKLDVEGYELQVLTGSRRALSDGRIRHIVFEDHDIARSAVAAFLQQFGFSVFAIAWEMTGPALRPAVGSGAARSYEAPSFIATLAPSDVEARIGERGWVALKSMNARTWRGPA